ncbi:MAG: hypothetical protein AB7F31_04980 [Parachlamydiales bacterium]
MIESTHLFPQLNRDVEQHIWSFLDLHELDRVAVSSKGGQASIGHFRQTQPDWWVVRELRREGCPVDTETYHKAGQEAVKACSELWGKEKAQWDKQYNPVDQEIRQLGAQISALNSRSTRHKLGSVGLFLSLSIYGLVRKCWRLPYPKLALWGGFLALGPVGLWQLGRHYDSQLEPLNSKHGTLWQQKEEGLDLVTNKGFNRQASFFLARQRESTTIPASLGEGYELFFWIAPEAPLSKLRYGYKLDELAKQGLVSRNQFIAAKILIQMQEGKLALWLQKAEKQSREELIGKMTLIRQGLYRADPELTLVVWDKGQAAQRPTLSGRDCPDESPLTKVFTRLVIQDARLKLGAHLYPLISKPFCFHSLYGIIY